MNKPNKSSVTNLYTEYSINELYGNDTLSSYLEVEDMDIQSMIISKRGKEKKLSYKNISAIWDKILIGLTKEKSIRLSAMLMLYKDRSTTKAIKNEVVQKIFYLAMKTYYHGKEINHEAIIHGIGMMFEDKLYWDDPDSLIHIIGKNAEVIMSIVNEIPQKSTV